MLKHLLLLLLGQHSETICENCGTALKGSAFNSVGGNETNFSGISPPVYVSLLEFDEEVMLFPPAKKEVHRNLLYTESIPQYCYKNRL